MESPRVLGASLEEARLAPTRVEKAVEREGERGRAPGHRLLSGRGGHVNTFEKTGSLYLGPIVALLLLPIRPAPFRICPFFESFGQAGLLFTLSLLPLCARVSTLETLRAPTGPRVSE